MNADKQVCFIRVHPCLSVAQDFCQEYLGILRVVPWGQTGGTNGETGDSHQFNYPIPAVWGNGGKRGTGNGGQSPIPQCRVFGRNWVIGDCPPFAGKAPSTPRCWPIGSSPTICSRAPQSAYERYATR